MTPTINVNIYVIHYTKLSKRKNTAIKLKSTFSNILLKAPHVKMNIKEVSKFDPETLNQEFVKRIFKSDDVKKDDGENEFFNAFKMDTPHVNFVSNCLKHLDALNMISKNEDITDDDINMIVEDDVMYDSSFEECFISFLQKNYNKLYDIVYLGYPSSAEEKSAFNAGSENATVLGTDNTIHLLGMNESMKVLPCCDSYVVSKTTAKKIIGAFIPIRYPNNVQMSYIIDKLQLKIGKTSPNIMIDGSKVGVYPSTITPNNILLFNTSFKYAYKILEKQELSNDDIDIIEKIFESNPIKNSADFIFLEGLFNLKTKQYAECKILFDRAIEEYESHHALLNNQSVIIQNYIELCKHI
jgi:GR25 family glycosyltransferase involved in LPS biosynthesis